MGQILRCGIRTWCLHFNKQPQNQQRLSSARKSTSQAGFKTCRTDYLLRHLPLTFFRNRVGNVEARIPTMTTSEIILTVDEDLETELSIEDTKCRVDNALLIGCYKCSKGAVAQVTCRSSKPTLAEIICDQTSFTIKCNERGQQSSLLFSFSQARVHMTCSVSCGSEITKFELSGILKFTQTAQAMANYWVKGTRWRVGKKDGDIKLVIRFWRSTRVLDQQQIQMELEMAAISLQRQKKIASTLVTQWNHHKNEHTFICASAGEQFSFTTHCLREAEVTKEKILRMGTRYLIMDFLYEYITEWGEASSFGRQDFIARKRDYAFGPEAIRDLITTQRDILDIEITDMKAMMERQEREMKEKDPLTSMHVQRIRSERNRDALRRKMDEQQSEMMLLQETMATKTTPALTEEQEDNDQELENEEDEIEEFDGEEGPDNLDNDDCYWNNMVSEVTDETSNEDEASNEDGTSKEGVPSNHGLPSKDSINDSYKVELPAPSIHSTVREVEEKLLQMRVHLNRFPFRDRRDKSQGISRKRTCAFCGARGVHFSDACPFVRNGDTRYNIIDRKEWCVHCLEAPKGHPCRYRKRECFYCYRLSFTVFEDLRRSDGGFHHRAVCNVPDKKMVAYARMKETERELMAAEERGRKDGQRMTSFRFTVFEDLRRSDGGFHHRAVCNVPDKKMVAYARMKETERELWRLRSVEEKTARE
ncbi:hypothetical protein OSTOST_03283 [Ostertagia ostertagi]